MRSRAAVALAALVWIGVEGCAGRPDGPTRAEIETAVQASVARVLDRELERIAALADSVDEVFRPLPLMTAADEAALRRHPNREHVARARALGIPRAADAAEREAHVRGGRLVALEDSTAYWVVRELDRSMPLVVPDARALLVRIGERFQARLDDLGVPALRFEVSSVLRTAEDQATLRRGNPNAARGASAHEFGTTVDIAYDGFVAPARPAIDVRTAAAPWLEPRLDRLAAALLERVAARRSREIQAIFADVLLALQAEGKVLVTLERRQPVYHLTVARRLEAPAPR